MPTRTRISIYIAFIVTLAVWGGSGVFFSISSHPGWWADPVSYTRGAARPEGTVNPWPFTTAALALCTLAALAAFARYRGRGRRAVLAVLAGVFAILVATGVWFVPTLGRLANHTAMTDAQITSVSHLWMTLNLLRIVAVLALLTCALVGLMRLAEERVRAAAG